MFAEISDSVRHNHIMKVNLASGLLSNYKQRSFFPEPFYDKL